MRMGAWGHGSFDNDDAADWVQTFELHGVTAVVTTLERVANFPKDEYLEAPETSAAIAAAEVVAAVRDGDLASLSDEARNAFATHQQSLTGSRMLELARQTVERILHQSELKDLWEESAEGDMWVQGIGNLSSRLR